MMSQGKKLIDKINKLTEKIESNPENVAFYRKRAGIYFENNEFHMALNDYDKAIETRPKIADYFERGLTHLKMENHDNAIADFNKVIAHRSALWNAFLKFEVPLSYLFRGYCHYKLGNDQNSLRDLSSFEIKLGNNLPYGMAKAIMDHIFIKKYNGLLEEMAINSSIHSMLKIMEFLFFISHKKDMLDFAKFLDSLTFGSKPSEHIQNLMSNVFKYYPNFTGSLSKNLKKDGAEKFFINAKLSILEYKYFEYRKRLKKTRLLLFIILVSLLLSAYFFLGSYIGICFSMGFIISFIYFPITFDSQIPLYFNLKKTLHEKKEQEIARARVDERNKIIADLSHSIKNLVSTIIDPLKNLRKEKEVKPAIIDDALKGANLIREIVNAMNLSFRGSVEDFYHDASNGGKGGTDLHSALVESLIYSVGNMFDGKYFPDFQVEYFFSEEILDEAESEWTRISQSKDLHEITPFLQKYFFEIDFGFDNAADYTMGNEKGSAIKFLILFQELIFNAVKYSAFVRRENRRLQIHFNDTPEQITIRIANPYNEKINISTSGIGHVIVENFCKLMETKPVVTRENGIYAVEIRFANFWKEKIG